MEGARHTFRFFAAVEGGEVHLDVTARQHLHVLRAVRGDTLDAFDRRGHVYRCRLQALTRHEARATIIATRYERRPATSITAVLGAQAGTVDVRVLRSLTELSIARFLIFRHQHDARGKIHSSRVLRWRKIIISACEQCKRAWLPDIELIPEWEELTPTLAREFTVRLALQRGGECSLPELLRSSPSGNVCMLVGAAGGFSATELAALRSVPVRFVDLGMATLRTETAAVFFAGFVNFWQREWLR